MYSGSPSLLTGAGSVGSGDEHDRAAIVDAHLDKEDGDEDLLELVCMTDRRVGRIG